MATAGCRRCWKCKEGTGCIRSIGFSQTAMPTRYPETNRIVSTEGRWHEDMGAYQRMRRNGVQPPRIDDCAALETRANDQFEVEMAKIVPKERKSQVKEGLAISRELQVARPASVKVPDA